MKYVILKNNTTIRKIISSARQITSLGDLPDSITIDFNIDDLIEVSEEVQGNWSYDAITQTFIAPPEPRKIIISKYELRERLTISEKMVLDSPELVADIPSELVPLLIVFKNDLAVANEINLDMDSLVDGLNQLMQYGLITQERVNAIRGLPEGTNTVELAKKSNEYDTN